MLQCSITHCIERANQFLHDRVDAGDFSGKKWSRHDERRRHLSETASQVLWTNLLRVDATALVDDRPSEFPSLTDHATRWVGSETPLFFQLERHCHEGSLVETSSSRFALHVRDLGREQRVGADCQDRLAVIADRATLVGRDR